MSRSKALMVGSDHAHCAGCPKLLRLSELNGEGYCRECWGSLAHSIAERRYVAEQKGLVEATKKLADQIAARGKNSALSPEFFDSFSRELGGASGLGKRLADDFKRLHGEDLTAEDAAYFTKDEKTIQRYWQTIAAFMQNQDKMNAVDVSSLSDKELQATLLGLATSLMEENEDFREHVIKTVCKSNPKLIESLAIEAGLIRTVEGRVSVKPEEDGAIDLEDI